MKIKQPALRILSAALITIFSGCAAVGPDYVSPESSAPGKWNYTPDDINAARLNPQTLEEWWKTFNDPILNDLIARAVTSNLDMKNALAKIEEARARTGITRAAQFPDIDLTGSATTSKSSKKTGNGETRDFFSAGFDAGWEIDIFGSVRRSLEAAKADYEAVEADMRDVMVTMTAEVALNYVEIRMYQRRLELATQNLKAQHETYDLVNFRYKAGLSNALDVERSTYSLEDTRSRIPVLQGNLEKAKNRLSVLLGLNPGAINSLVSKPGSIPWASSKIAVGVPADMLRRRPDVRRAERKLAAQTARIGVAAAELYPRFTLSGSIGLEALAFHNLFSLDSLTESIGPRVSWKIFDARAIRKNIAIQNALQEQALIQYEAAILTALEEVENTLISYAQEQIRLKSLSEATKSAQNAVSLALHHYQSGVIDFQDVLETQRSLLSYQDQTAESYGSVMLNLIKLYKSLGGGIL